MSKLDIVDVPIYKGNWRVGRAGPFPIDRILIHVMEGNMEGTRQWFNNPKSEVSAHYGISTKGLIARYVREEDTAFHAGILDHPTADIVIERYADGRYTPNSYSIGIEHEGDGTHELTPEQRAASYALIQDIRERRPGIVLARAHILGHHEVRAAKTCPGKIDVDKIVNDLRNIPTPTPAPETSPPMMVWSDYLKDWCVVTSYVDDEHWRFARLSEIKRSNCSTYAAQTPLSQMPLNPR